MKHLILFCLTLCSFLPVLPAQGLDFAPVGAKWYYSELNFALKVIPHTIESVSKENYQGKWCSKLMPSSFGSIDIPTRVYTENDTVYYFSPSSNQFEMLYDFTAEVGDRWIIGGFPAFISDYPTADTITVDSISSMVVGGDTLKVWHISNTIWYDWGDIIIEKMGNDKLFMPKFGLVEAYIWGLRCFESPSEAYHLVPYPCDTTYSTISTTLAPNESAGFEVVPNPAHSTFTVSGPWTGQGHLSLLDMQGKLLLSKTFWGSEVVTELDASIPSGIYLVKILTDDGTAHVEKLVVQVK